MEFDPERFVEDLGRASATGRTIAIQAREQREREGVHGKPLARCEAEGHDGTRPQACATATNDYDVVMSAKSSPVSVRISKRLEALVDQEARRTGRSRSAVLESLADEALRMRLFPGVAFRGADWERRAWVIGTAFDVWQIVDAYRDVGSAERMAAQGAASERQIRLALAYYERFPDEIDAAIADNRRPLEQLREEHPFIAVSDASA